MNAVFDSLVDPSGWSGTGSITASLNEVPEFIAGLGNVGSLVVNIPAGNKNRYITKSTSFNFTKYNELTFHLWSRNKANLGNDYNLATDYAYSLRLTYRTSNGHGGWIIHNNDYYIPTFSGFNDVSLYVDVPHALYSVTIFCLHDDEDYLILSNMVASKDEIPRDLFQGIKEQLDAEMLNVYSKFTDGVTSKGILLGQVSGATGDTAIYNIDSFNWLQRYACILIDDGVNTETHQINNNDDRDFTFTGLYDGEALLNDYSGADLYLIVPVEYGTTEREIILPGVSIWGFAPEEILRTNKIEEFRDTFQPSGTVYSRLTPITFQYIIMLDCEARQNEMLALMSLACRTLIGKQIFWLNGKKVNMFIEGIPDNIEPMEGYNEIPKIQYKTRVEVKEDIYDRTQLIQAISQTLTVQIN